MKSFGNWKIIFKYLFEYKKQIVLLSILGIISALANGFVPYLMGRFFDSILSPSKLIINNFEISFWLFIVFVWLLVQLIAHILDWIIDIKNDYISLELEQKYNAKGFGYILKLPMQFHKDNKTGEVFDKINRAAQWLGTIIRNVVIRLAPQFLSVIIGLVISFLINWIFGLILVIGLLIYIFLLSKIVPPAIKLQRKANLFFGKIYGGAWEKISFPQVVKQSTAEDYEVKAFNNNFVNIGTSLWGKIQAIWRKVGFYQRLIITFTQLTVFLVSVYFIFNDAMTVGDLIAINAYAAMVFGPFVVLGYNWQTIQNGLLALERSEKLLALPIEDYHPKGGEKITNFTGEIEFRKTSFSYKKSGPKILNNINLKIKPGQTVALVGESGVGKSTVVDLMSGYYFADKGQVLIDGIDIKKIDLTFLRKNIAIVPQEVFLFDGSIKSNIKYGTFTASDEDMKKAAKKAYASDFIEKMPKKYNQIIGERGIKLSVGQKQRVAIAKAILQNPKILILDEPTSALDIKTEKYITEALEALMEGRTSIIIAHRLSTVRKADKIFVFDRGRIVETGTHNELIKKKDGLYHGLYKLHIGLD